MPFSVSVKEAQVVQVIRTEIELRGRGDEHDHARRVTQYWSLEGELLAEHDPCAKQKPSHVGLTYEEYAAFRHSRSER